MLTVILHHYLIIEHEHINQEYLSLGMSDPYGIIWISSDPEKQHNTSTRQQTLNPEWNERFIL